MRLYTSALSPRWRLRAAVALLMSAVALPATLIAAPPTDPATPHVAPLGEDAGPAALVAPQVAPGSDAEQAEQDLDDDADEDVDEDADEEPLVPPIPKPPAASRFEAEGAETSAVASDEPPPFPGATVHTSAQSSTDAYYGTDAYGRPLSAEEAALLAEDDDGPDPESGLMTQAGVALALGKASDALGRSAGSNAGTAVRAFIGAAILPQLCLGVTGVYASAGANNKAYTIDTQGLLLTGQWRPFGGERRGVVLGLGLGLGSTRLTQAREEKDGTAPFVGASTGGIVALSLGWTADALNLGAHNRISLAPTFTWMRLPAQAGGEVGSELFTLGIDLRWMASTGPRQD